MFINQYDDDDDDGGVFNFDDNVYRMKWLIWLCWLNIEQYKYGNLQTCMSLGWLNDVVCLNLMRSL